MNFKNGLDYFPIDIDFFEDEKIEFVSARFGIKGELITIRLLSRIYRNGYFLSWDDDNALLIAKKCGEGITGALIKDVVDELVRRDFFNKVIFNSFNTLTSHGIQKRFFEAVKRRKKVTVIEEFLVPEFKNIHNENILRENVNIKAENVDILRQSKVEKSKVEKSREKESNSAQARDPVFKNPFSENFLKDWELWKKFKQEQFGFSYKKNLSEQAAINDLVEISKGDEVTAKKIIHQSIAKGWKGFFELKNQVNGSASQNTGKQPTGGQVSTQSAFDAIDQYYAKDGST